MAVTATAKVGLREPAEFHSKPSVARVFQLPSRHYESADHHPLVQYVFVSCLQLLYDLVFEKAADPKSPAWSSTHRDTKNSTMLTHDRNLGGQLTTNRLAFTAPTEFDKPEFARKPLIRDTFYRSGVRRLSQV